MFCRFSHYNAYIDFIGRLLSRIVAPEAILHDSDQATDNDVFSLIHDHTYGITSDPLTQFACVFSALIHDGTSFPLWTAWTRYAPSLQVL